LRACNSGYGRADCTCGQCKQTIGGIPAKPVPGLICRMTLTCSMNLVRATLSGLVLSATSPAAQSHDLHKVEAMDLFRAHLKNGDGTAAFFGAGGGRMTRPGGKLPVADGCHWQLSKDGLYLVPEACHGFL
jgi:hypothetical protein